MLCTIEIVQRDRSAFYFAFFSLFAILAIFAMMMLMLLAMTMMLLLLLCWPRTGYDRVRKICVICAVLSVSRSVFIVVSVQRKKPTYKHSTHHSPSWPNQQHVREEANKKNTQKVIRFLASIVDLLSNAYFILHKSQFFECFKFMREKFLNHINTQNEWIFFLCVNIVRNSAEIRSRK